ncbi:MAG: FtsX-like permease family protein [Vulcanimicrobiota bacterium]
MLLRRAYWNYLRSVPWLGWLGVLGVALAVAVVVAMDLASESARRSFELSSRALTGGATHLVRAATGSLDETLYAELRQTFPGVAARPVVEGFVTLELQQPVSLHLLGLDPLAPFEQGSSLVSGGGMRGLMGSPDGVVMTRQTARRLGLSVGSPIPARLGQRRLSLRLAGLLEPADGASETALANLLLADISTAQHILDQKGRLSRIDLSLVDPAPVAAWLPPSTTLEPSGSQSQALEEMTSAFHLNLKALSLLSLVVGMFLVYNVTAFSVVHRRPALARLRTLGALPEELFLAVMSETLAVAGLGTLLGLGLGCWLGRQLVFLVTRTLNDLYYVLELTSYSIDPLVLVKGLCLGILTSLAAAFGPAREAGHTLPALLVHRSGLEAASLLAWRRVGLAGLLLLLAAGLVVRLPGLWAGLLTLLLVLVGAALVTPGLVTLLVSLVPSRPLPLELRLALRSIPATLSRTGIATSALMIAVAATVSIGLMVHSFRTTLRNWLETTLQADVYITLPDRAAMLGGERLSGELLEQLKTLPGVSDYTTQSQNTVVSSTGQTQLVAVRDGGRYRQSLRFRQAVDDPWSAFEAGAVLVSEPYASRYRLEVGQPLRLLTEAGWQEFTIAGIFYSYGPERGLALMRADVFARHWKSPGASGIGLYLEDPEQAEAVVLEAQRLGRLEVRSTASIKALSLEIFERTFLVTGVLRGLALMVALVGIFGSLTALGLERIRELSTLRALGMTRVQVGRLLTVQSGLLGLFAGLLALPTGVVLAAVMVLVINQRAFGWTLFFSLQPRLLVEAVILSVAAALLAGLGPARTMAARSPAAGLREE